MPGDYSTFLMIEAGSMDPTAFDIPLTVIPDVYREVYAGNRTVPSFNLSFNDYLFSPSSFRPFNPL